MLNFSRIKALPILLIFLFATGCEDSNTCIEADDFGEYEYQTLKIQANALSGSCKLGNDPDPTDSSHGSGLKSCLTAENVVFTYYDETAEDKVIEEESGGAGCTNYDLGGSVINECMQQCVTECLSGKTDGDVQATNPSWKATDERSATRSYGVTIAPAAEIEISVSGDIQLGDDIDYENQYINPQNHLPHSFNSSGRPQFVDVNKGQILYPHFSGKWADGFGTTYGADIEDAASYNLAKRTVMYLIPAKQGYKFDVSKASAGSDQQDAERKGTIGTPIWADKGAWSCAPTNEGLSCGSYHKTTGLYPNIESETTAYPIASTNNSSRSPGLSVYGGMIRWSNDGLIGDDKDFFADAGITSCTDNGECVNSEKLAEYASIMGYPVGFILGDISSSDPRARWVNNSGVPIKISFKSFNSGCSSFNLKYEIFDNGRNSMNPTPGTAIDLPVTNSAWSSTHLTLEPGFSVEYHTPQALGGGNANCGLYTGAKISKYHDIRIAQSGFVSFRALNGGSVNLKARIINPEGSIRPFTIEGNSVSYNADYYEYGDFNSATDPFGLISVSSSSWQGNGLNSKDLFVRKGQIIRFSPESWNGDTISNKTGIGVAMHIEPRPALLCNSSGTNANIMNPQCELVDQDEDTYEPNGCRAQFLGCYDDSGAATYYCPSPDHQGAVTCTGYNADTFTKTGCSAAQPVSTTFTQGGTFNSGQCAACTNKILEQARTPAKITVNGVKECYDLENYRGSVANLVATSYNINNQELARGATILGNFNGNYGNLSGFKVDDESGPVRKSNYADRTIFKVIQPVSIQVAGRLKFFSIDNTNFTDIKTAYANNSAMGVYNGNNGTELEFKGPMRYSNGQYLDVKLCKETEPGKCSAVNLEVDDITSLVTSDITNTDGLTAPGSKYFFSSYGNIIRQADPKGDDCKSDPHNIQTEKGSNFFCHTKDFNNSDEHKKYRLSFKINDPEVPNCEIARPENNKRFNPSGTGWTGVIINNSGYVKGGTGNDGEFCSVEEESCTKEFRCASKYANNQGEYNVTVKAKLINSGSNVSSLIDGVITPVIETIDGRPKQGEDEAQTGQVERIYRALITDPTYKSIMKMSLILMVTFYGVSYMMGVSDFTNAEIVSRVLKISLIYFFVGEQGWEEFDKYIVRLFKNGANQLAFMMASSFDSSPDIVKAIENQDYNNKAILFSSVDRVFTLIFSNVLYKKISALLFASIFGWAYMLIILYSFLLYIYAVAHAVLLYLTAQIFISILFVLAPIFFIFLLFEQTKEMFDNWLKSLISFSLQQIFLMTTLAFFNILIYEVIKLTLGYRICFEPVWQINIFATKITILSSWAIASLGTAATSQRAVGDVGGATGIPSLFNILFIWIIASLMQNFVKFMTDLASSIGGGISATSLASGAVQAAQQAKKGAQDLGRSAYRKSGMKHAVDRVDQAVFDSGSLANKARHEKKQQNSLDGANKAAMSNAGDSAVREAKRNNPSISAEELKKVKDKAMTEKGKERGLSEKEISRLKSDKGIKYAGDNAFGLAGAAAKQAMFRGGSATEALKSGGGGMFKGLGAVKDDKINSSLSRKDIKEAMKRTDSKGRDNIMKGIKDGSIEVRTSNAQRIKNSALGAAGSAVRGGVAFAKNPRQTANAAAESAKKSLESFGSSATRAQEKAMKALKNVPSTAKKALSENKDYKNAREQLENEGTVSKRIGGSGALGRVARAVGVTSEEKSAIKERMEANKQAQATTPKKKATKATTAKSLDRFKEDLDEKEKIDAEYDSKEGDGNPLKGAEKVIRKKVVGMSKALQSSMDKARASDDKYINYDKEDYGPDEDNRSRQDIQKSLNKATKNQNLSAIRSQQKAIEKARIELGNEESAAQEELNNAQDEEDDSQDKRSENKVIRDQQSKKLHQIKAAKDNLDKKESALKKEMEKIGGEHYAEAEEDKDLADATDSKGGKEDPKN